MDRAWAKNEAVILPGAKVHFGQERRLEQDVKPVQRLRSRAQKVRSGTGYLGESEQALITERPSVLEVQQLEYTLAPVNRQLEISGEGLVTSYGIFGAPGSGKTHLFLYLLRQLLRYRRDDPEHKYGALILDPKAALVKDIRSMVAALGREDDLVVVNAGDLQGRDGVNVIGCSVDEYALGDLLVLAARSAGIAASEDYWFLEWANLFGASLFLLNRFDLRGVSNSADAVTLKRLLDALLIVRDTRVVNGKERPVRGIEQLAAKVRGHLNAPASQRLASLNNPDLREDAELAVNQVERFFRADYVDTIMAFIGRAYGPFQRSQYRCFSPRYPSKGLTPFYDQIIEDGKIVLVSVSPSDPLAAKTLCTLVKCLFQQTVMQRKDRFERGTGMQRINNAQRLLLLASDEYAEIASEVPGQPMGDGRFFSLSREFRCMGLLATQSVNVLEATSLKENWRSVFSTFAAKIFMRLVDNETAREASDLAGTSDWYVSSSGLSLSKDGSGISSNRSLQGRDTLPTEVTTQVLQKGDGVVIGSLDGGATPPALRFFHVPDERGQDEYIKGAPASGRPPAPDTDAADVPATTAPAAVPRATRQAPAKPSRAWHHELGETSDTTDRQHALKDEPTRAAVLRESTDVESPGAAPRLAPPTVASKHWMDEDE